MAGFAQRPYDLAISLRFGEANTEMVALKARLAERGLKVFLCDEAPGVDLKRTIFEAFSAADLAIIAASATYGRQTTSGFSTYEEMNFLQTEKKPYFLLKMTPSPNDKWEEVETRATYNMDVWEYWAPGAPMPEGLVDKIVAKLEAVRAAKPAAAAVAAPAAPASPAAAAAPGTPLGRIAACEEMLLGQAGAGAMLPRLQALEDAALGAAGAGAIPDRIAAVEAALGLAAVSVQSPPATAAPPPPASHAASRAAAAPPAPAAPSAHDTVRDTERERGKRGARGARARDSDARRPPPAPRQEENRKALWEAARDGKTEDVQRYIGMGVDVDWRDGVRVCARDDEREQPSVCRRRRRARVALRE